MDLVDVRFVQHDGCADAVTYTQIYKLKKFQPYQKPQCLTTLEGNKNIEGSDLTFEQEFSSLKNLIGVQFMLRQDYLDQIA